ncbi:MAG: DUF1553 domain-containing protein [Acidobacteriota bacterium]
MERTRIGRILVLLSAVIFCLCWLGGVLGQAGREVSFARDIRPILEARCLGCHNGSRMSGGLRLDRPAGVRRDSIIVPGRAAESRLYERITATGDEAMPPTGERLTAAQIGLIRDWIDAGAVWPEEATDAPAGQTHWAWRPVTRPAIPRLAIPRLAIPRLAESGARLGSGHPLDAFIQERLTRAGLQMSPEADRRTLIRRLSYDLTGLPPTPERVARFVRDRDPQAYEKLVDELLASPRYCERWARHWIDVVHYGDTHGYDKDKPRPHAWPYRDYVIEAFNSDKPYARFIEEQLAGDVLYPGTRDGYRALGFIAAGPWDFIGHAELPESKIDGKIARHLDRDDMVANTIGTFTSVTVHCAQCHHHTFDPIPQSDYYSLQAVFAALDRADLKYIPGSEAQTKQINELEGRQRMLADRKRSLEREATKLGGEPLRQLEARLAALPKDAPEQAARRRERDQLLRAALPEEKRRELDDLLVSLGEIDRELASLPKPEVVYAGMVWQGAGANFVGTGGRGGRPRPIHLLARGQVTAPGRLIEPGALGMLDFQPARFALPADAPEGARRVALARWITHRDHPLTWRSIVNRVWQYHFGQGIVATPNDFGHNGAKPSHPELLDWLATEFRDSGGSMKRLHRLIVTSAAYRQSSNGTQGRGVDDGNTLLWRQNRRKLEAEAIRDSVLTVSGTLVLRMGGPGWQDFVIERPEHSPHYEYGLADPEERSTWRRSIYRFIVRSQTQPWMTALDCADPSMRVDRRNESLSPLQALTMLNNGFMISQSRHFAARLEAERPGSLARQIDLAFALAFGRSPSPKERAALAAFAARHGLPNLCRTIFNLNEFAFVD